MATKITTKKISEVPASDLHVLITQTEDDLVSLRRMPPKSLFDKYGVNGLSYIDSKLQLMCNDTPVGTPITVVSGSGGGDYGSTMRLSSLTEARSFTVMDTAESVPIDYNVTSVDSETGVSTGNISVEWYVGSTRVYAGTVVQGDNTFDAKKYLTSGASNTVKIVATDSYGNSKNMSWAVTVAAYSISWNLDELSSHGSDAVVASIVVNGSGDKLLNVTVDGESLIENKVISTTGRTERVTIEAQSHGSHTVLAWFTVDLDGQTVKSEVKRHVGVWTESGNTTPVVALHADELTVGQWGTVGVKYLVIDPAGETAAVTLKEDNSAVNTLDVGRTVQTWAYRGTELGTHELSIHCGDVSATAAVEVTSSGYDIAPITAGLVMDIDPSGHSNSEAGRSNFGYTDGSGVNHPFTFSDNFDWVEGGFQLDEDGVTAFVIKRGCYVTADRSLFADNAKISGKEIKLIFKATNVRNYDAELLNCMSGKVGLTVQAQQVTLGSELETMTALYCEDRKIEMDVNIEAESEGSLAYICMKAIPSCKPVQYGAADSWVQTAPSMLTIGSADADVWIYRMKMYGNSLTRFELLDNYIADCADTTEMLDRYERNDIFADDGTISIAKLTARNPELRAVHIKAKRMTTGKSDDVTADVEIIYEAGGETHHLIATDVVFKAQGTSSLEYILAALNLDIDFSAASSWVNGNGETISAYAFTDESIPVDYFNFKADVASSECANNVVLCDDFNSYNPTPFDGKTDGVRDTVEGHPCAVFFTNTSGAAVTVGARTVQAGETILYFAGNMNNSKKNYKVFGWDNEKWPEQCCMEVLNNTSMQCRFRSDDLSGETYTGADGDNFEWAFPKKPTASMLSNFQKLVSWVVSTAPDLATGAALEPAVILNGTTYANDTTAYRNAKWLAEVDDYFVRDQLLFHFLKTERHCMVDNRSKNTFLCYDYYESLGGYRWSFRRQYDGDTAEGNDNSGGATFGYGLELHDMVGDSYAFNAHDNTIWVNVANLMQDELARVYKGNKDAWDSNRIIKKFNDYQAITPEALRIEDMRNKYIVPGEDSYRKQCHGTKEYWREQFEVYQSIYMDSKYCDTSDRSNCISLRATVNSAAAGNIDITPYSDLYIVVMYGTNGTVRIRAKRNQTYTVECPADSLSDTEIYIFSASNLTELGSLANLKTKFVTLTKAGKLQVLPIGSDEAGYQNLNMTALSLGSNTLLEYLDLRGLPNLVQLLDLSALTSLEEFYGNGSGITGLVFAQGAPLKIARVPAVTSFTARDLTQLETFVMDGAGLVSLWVENSPGIDTLALCTAATGLSRGRLTGVDWTAENADVLIRLAGLQSNGGLDASGATIDGFVLTGKAYCATVTQDEIDTITAAFPGLALSYGEIVSSHQVSFQYADGTVMQLKDGSDAVFTVRHGGSLENPITAGLMDTPTKASTVEEHFTYTGWSAALTNIVSDMVINPVFGATTRYYTVKHWYDDAESSLLQTDTVAAHGSVAYNGTALTKSDGSLWMGWDTPTTDVVSDMDVHAVFITPKLPDAVATDYDFLYSDNPADNSGYTLAELCGIIKAGREQEYFAVKDKIKATPNTDVFADTEIICMISGWNHTRLADTNVLARVEWDFLGLMNATRRMNATNTNAGGYPATEMFEYAEKAYQAMPLWFRTIVPKAIVRSSKGGTSAEIVQAEAHFYLRSHAEVGFDTTAVPYVNEVDPEAESVALPIYTDNGSRIKKTYNGTGSAGIWWLRSPDPASSAYYRYVYNSGNASSSYATSASGVSFGFVTNL